MAIEKPQPSTDFELWWIRFSLGSIAAQTHWIVIDAIILYGVYVHLIDK